MAENDPIDALKHLGLTGYEAQVFVALQRLGTGTASDVDRISDVPRSQVYGAAEKLQERGLIDVQQSSPIQYRPVSLKEAREHLRTRYEQREETAFEHLKNIQTSGTNGKEHQEDIWTLYGYESIDRRASQLAADAEAEIVYGCGEETLSVRVASTLQQQAASNGVQVTVVSAACDVFDEFRAYDDVRVRSVPAELTLEPQQTGRILIVDTNTLLLSVFGDEEGSGTRRETAIWSAETGFAAIFIRLIESWFDEHVL
jgi:sugar-specific transcriptional regulator TrmB